MADTEKKTGLSTRMGDFYFEITNPDGTTEVITDAETEDEEE